MPLLLIALLAAGSAYGAKKFYDTKNPKFFFYLDKGVTEEEKANYTHALFSDDISIPDIQAAAAYALHKGHKQTAEILGERILTLLAAQDPSIAVYAGSHDNSIDYIKSLPIALPG